MERKNKARRVILQNSLIVSCQTESNSAFNNKKSILAFSKEAELGGASGLRLRGEEYKLYQRLYELTINRLNKDYFLKQIM